MAEKRLKLIYPIGMVAVLLAYFLALEIGSPLFFFRDDNSTFFLPVYFHNFQVLMTDGELAQANLHQFMGSPHLASAQSAVLYPPVYLAVGIARHLLGDVRQTINLLVIVHLLVGALGMYGLARYCKCSRFVAALAGIAWATLPFTLILARAWVFVSYLSAYLPLHALLLLHVLDAPHLLRRVVVFSLLKAAYITTGYVQFFVLSSLFEATFLAIRWYVNHDLRRPWRPELLAMLGSTALVCGLAAPFLLPVIQAKSVSEVRSAPLSIDQVLFNAMSFRHFVSAQLMLPVPNAIFESSSAIFYLGLPVFVTGCIVVWQFCVTDERSNMLLMGTCALVGLVALLLSTKLYRVMCWIDLMATFRWPFKSFSFAVFFLFVSSLLAWQRWQRTQRLSIAMLLFLIASHVYLVAPLRHAHPFADFQLQQTQEELSQSPIYRLTAGFERVATVANEPDGLAPLGSSHEIMGFHYATLGNRYHFSGYDPLLPKRQTAAARGVNHTAQLREPITPDLIDYLASWSVRWLVTPKSSPNASQLQRQTNVRHVADAQSASLFEIMSYQPLATIEPASIDATQNGPIAVKCAMHGNRIDLDTVGEAGRLTLNCVYHPAYKLYADGEFIGLPVETPDHRMACRVPQHAESVSLRFDDSQFRHGMELAAFTGLISLGLCLLRDTNRLHQRHSPLRHEAATAPDALQEVG